MVKLVVIGNIATIEGVKKCVVLCEDCHVMQGTPFSDLELRPRVFLRCLLPGNLGGPKDSWVMDP